MPGFLGEVGAAWQFLAAGLKQFPQNASLFPSSPFLVRAMVDSVPLARAKCVVELGPGVGTVTEEILKYLPPGAHLHAIELDRRHLDTTVERIRDARLRPIHGTAAETPALLAADGCSLGADVVFSSLGLALMEPALRHSIVQAASRVLHPRGLFVQYAYLHARLVTYTRTEGLTPFHAGRFLDRHFEEIQEEYVLANAPPASVFVCRKPRPGAQPLHEPARRKERNSRRSRARESRHKRRSR